MHRKKAYGFIKLAIQSGRVTTNNQPTDEEKLVCPLQPAWIKINSSLQDGSKERLHDTPQQYSTVHIASTISLAPTVLGVTLKNKALERVILPGDKIQLMPNNSDAVVSRIIAYFKLEFCVDNLITLPSNWVNFFKQLMGQSPHQLSLRNLLKYAEDLFFAGN